MEMVPNPNGGAAVISAQFRIQLPEDIWVAELSTRYPETAFRLLSGYKLDERALELGEVRGDRPEEVVAAMEDHPAIHGYELLESGRERALGKYETADTGLYEFVERSGFTIEFPVEVEAGWYEFDLTGTREELDRLQSVLDASPYRYELDALVTTAETDSLLTDRQRELLEAAVREGYFEVPRRCTLADLAESVGVDKSTASTVLRRGEARLVKWFLSGPD
jgi:predicted DNA binding protein